jgi:hypothetical protein
LGKKLSAEKRKEIAVKASKAAGVVPESGASPSAEA